MENVLINADDFGLNSSVNHAIANLFQKELINSTTLMANMPGFEEAIVLAHQYNLIDKIGIHLALTDGNPLTEEIKSINFLFKGKEQYKRYKHRLFFLSQHQKQLIYNEFVAQIEKIQSEGIPITHIDTHHHVHEAYGILKIILTLQKRFNIPSIRILNNMERSSKWYKKLYRNRMNHILISTGNNYSDLFGNQFDFLSRLKFNPLFLKNKIAEIMVHPDYQDSKLIDRAGEKDYDFKFIQSLELNAHEI